MSSATGREYLQNGKVRVSLPCGHACDYSVEEANRSEIYCQVCGQGFVQVHIRERQRAEEQRRREIFAAELARRQLIRLG